MGAYPPDSPQGGVDKNTDDKHGLDLGPRHPQEYWVNKVSAPTIPKLKEQLTNKPFENCEAFKTKNATSKTTCSSSMQALQDSNVYLIQNAGMGISYHTSTCWDR